MPGSVWADLFWPVFGVGVTVGALLATRVGIAHDNRRLLVLTYAVQALGVAIAVVWPTVAGFALSSLLAGLPFTARSPSPCARRAGCGAGRPRA